MKPTLTLQAVANDFTAWRKTRSIKGSKATPLTLQQKALALLNDYPKSHIIKTLGINHAAIKRWSTREVKISDTTYIPLPLPVQQQNDDSANTVVRCEFPNGLRLALPTSGLTTELLQQIYGLSPKQNQ